MTKKEVCSMESAPANAKYVTMELDPTLTNERVVQAGPGMIVTDEGADRHVVFTSFLPYVEDTSLEANAFTVELDPAPESYYTGLAFSMKAANTATGPSTVSVGVLGVKSLKKTNGLDIAAGDIAADQVVVVLYDGTNFLLLTERVTTTPTLTWNSQTFTATGTFTLPTNLYGNMVWVTICGGGGGGGYGGASYPGGGGGAGGAVEMCPCFVNSDVTVTIGTGGAGGTSGTPAGGNGLASSIGSVSATGGKGGIRGTALAMNQYGGNSGDGARGGLYFSVGSTTTGINKGQGGRSGGGGGAGSAMSNYAGDGGDSTYFPGGAGGSSRGGGGGASIFATGGAGASGAGGAGSQGSGGAGGGPSSTYNGGAGGDGKCIVYYITTS